LQQQTPTAATQPNSSKTVNLSPKTSPTDGSNLSSSNSNSDGKKVRGPPSS
jgi:hypothetical protein